MSSIALEAVKQPCAEETLGGNIDAPGLVAKFGVTLRSPSGCLVLTEEIISRNSVVAIYFSAHWCPPCRKFTPILCKKYNTLKEVGKSFEIIFVSIVQNHCVS